MKLFILPEDFSHLTKRPADNNNKVVKAVKKIYKKVETKGDKALYKLTKKLDKVSLSHLSVTHEEIQKAITQVPNSLVRAISTAYSNIYKFHQLQITHDTKTETTKGVACWQSVVPIDSIGIYIPGGTAPLFSTVLMLAIPALLAKVPRIVLCTPPREDGSIHPFILYAAHKCGVNEIYKLGGAQAIAALSIGTQTIEKVNKIFGPGNQYVTMAKMISQYRGTAIDMPAGPSEVLVFADETSNPTFVASDLLSQAEHGHDSQVVLVCKTEEFVHQVMLQIELQTKKLDRKDYIIKTLKNSMAVVLANTESIFNFINEYAPEHLIISSTNAHSYKEYIRNAGSVFLGLYTPESAGDYASGTNHTLPTSGHAKAYSGVNIDAFIKKITFQSISEEGLMKLGPKIITLAKAEGLNAHAQAVSLRIRKTKPLNTDKSTTNKAKLSNSKKQK